MVESKNTELVVLMKLIAIEEQSLEFIPEKVIEGSYIENDKLFVNYNTGNTYYHISEILLAENFITYNNIYFYSLRETKENLEKLFPGFTIEEIKEKLLSETLKYTYYIGIGEESLAEFEILKINKDTGEVEIFKDTDSNNNILKQTTINQTEELNDYEEAQITNNTTIKSNKSSLSFNPYELSKKVKEDIIGQNEAVDKVIQSLWCNYYFMDDEDYNKENILLIGPSGVGKTAIFQSIEKLLPDIPVHIADLSSTTESGIVGDSLEDIIKALLIKCIEISNGMQFVNINKANHAIIVLDEFDKIAIKNNNNTDVGNEPVQQELLKIIEGKEILIKLNLNGTSQFIPINTKNITFVCCGAFEGITKDKNKKFGFNQDVSQNNKSKSYSEVTDEDIKKYGFITELVGRIPSIITLNNLSLETLIKIIKKPKRSLFIKKLKLLKSIVEEVEIQEDLYEAIAKNAFQKKTGARGIDKVSVDLFNEILTEIQNPEYEYKYAMLNKETVEDPKKYKLKKVKKIQE